MNTKTQVNYYIHILIALIFGISAIGYFGERLSLSYEPSTEVTYKASRHLPENPDKQEGRLLMAGKASYYDYVLSSGWSSEGHYVCATRDFERYSFVKVTNLENDKTVRCYVTDHGPDEDIFPERIIDLSSTSFAAIADLKLGVIEVLVEQL